MSQAAYQLSKAVPNMAGGFAIHTSYGEIHVNADDPECKAIIAQVKKLLEKRRSQETPDL